MKIAGTLTFTSSDNTHQNVYATDISKRAAALVSRGTNQTGGNSRSIFPRFSNNDQSVVYFSAMRAIW